MANPLIFAEDFSGAWEGSAVWTATTKQTNINWGNGSAVVSGGEGVLTPSTSGARLFSMTASHVAVKHFEFTAKFFVPSGGVSSTTKCTYRVRMGTGRTLSQFGTQIDDVFWMSLAFTDLASDPITESGVIVVPAGSVVPNSWYRVRMNVKNHVAKIKVWRDTDPEPSTWVALTTRSDLVTTYRPVLMIQGSSTGTVTYTPIPARFDDIEVRATASDFSTPEVSVARLFDAHRHVTGGPIHVHWDGHGSNAQGHRVLNGSHIVWVIMARQLSFLSLPSGYSIIHSGTIPGFTDSYWVLENPSAYEEPLNHGGFLDPTSFSAVTGAMFAMRPGYEVIPVVEPTVTIGSLNLIAPGVTADTVDGRLAACWTMDSDSGSGGVAAPAGWEQYMASGVGRSVQNAARVFGPGTHPDQPSGFSGTVTNPRGIGTMWGAESVAIDVLPRGQLNMGDLVGSVGAHEARLRAAGPELAMLSRSEGIAGVDTRGAIDLGERAARVRSFRRRP